MPPKSYSLSQIFGVGLTISLEYEEDGQAQYVLSRVEDLDKDVLWVAMPTRANMFLPLPLDTPVVAYVKHDDQVFLLHATISGRRLQPTPMLELTPSQKIERRQPREYARLRIALVPTSVVPLDGDEVGQRLAATIVNISAGGLLMRSRQEIPVGRRLHLVVELPVPNGLLDTELKVLRVDLRRAERGHYFEAGCSFVRLPARGKEIINMFVSRTKGPLPAPTTPA